MKRSTLNPDHFRVGDRLAAKPGIQNATTKIYTITGITGGNISFKDSDGDSGADDVWEVRGGVWEYFMFLPNFNDYYDISRG